MDPLRFLDFAAVPLRARHDGWTASAQRDFILRLARGAGIGEAARALGFSRQSAYALRRRRGAESFASAWDSAVALGRNMAAVERREGAFAHGAETLLVPRYYRGRLIGFVQRDDNRSAMRALRSIDRMLDRRTHENCQN
jgi:hypothetical protein